MLIDEAVKNDDPKAFRLQDLAKNVGLTPRYLHKIFKDKTGVTPKEWAKARTSSQSNSTTTPILMTGPSEAAEDETVNWDTFNYNDFNNLVDFDIDGSATLGYNLVTGATESVSMGHGNVIDTSILYELWDTGYEDNALGAGYFADSENPRSNCGNISAQASMWPVGDKQMPVTSAFELDIDALLRCDSVLF
jgi:hypothetical protein